MLGDPEVCSCNPWKTYHGMHQVGETKQEKTISVSTLTYPSCTIALYDLLYPLVNKHGYKKKKKKKKKYQLIDEFAVK